MPAPQAGEPDHYGTFIQRIGSKYAVRFMDLSWEPVVMAASIEEDLKEIAHAQRELLLDLEEWLELKGAGGHALRAVIRRILDESAAARSRRGVSGS